jgi:DNA-binding transcriptional ArsR family regulator
MKRRFLEDCLAEGMSLEAIGELAGKHPSTVSYWLKKHGLEANGARKYARRGSLCAEQLKPLVDSGATLSEMAERLNRSPTTIRYWLARYGIRSPNGCGPRRRRGDGKTAIFECRHHGHTEFTLEGRGHYRCKRCRSEAVVDRRRKVKRQLVDEAGGACVLCGYRRWVGALQFHHLDPGRKEFHVSHRGHSRSLARSRSEIRKCVLLCANCHAEVEGRFATLPVDLRSCSTKPQTERDA